MKFGGKQANDVGGKSGNPSEERVSRKRISSTISNVIEKSRKVGTEIDHRAWY